MPSSHLILWCPLFPLSVFPSIGNFSKESVVRSRWAKNWTFSFSISASNEYSVLISLKICLICLLSKGFSEVFSSTTVQIVTSAIILWNVTGYHILTPKRKNHYQALNFRVNENLLPVNPFKNINIYSRQDAFKRETDFKLVQDVIIYIWWYVNIHGVCM